jgi:undecaprenyl-phosphate galactose phosphotransferase
MTLAGQVVHNRTGTSRDEYQFMSARERVDSKTSQRTCFAALLLADIVAVMSSLIASFVCSQYVQQRLALPRYSSMDAAQCRNALLELGLPIVGVLVIHMAQGHYHRRIPFWSEARQAILSCIIGLLTSGLFEFLSGLQTSRLILIGTWLLMPILILSLRRVTKRGLTLAGLWQIPVLIVGDQTNVQSASAVLLSDSMLGYHVADCANPASLALIAGELGWPRLLQRYGAQLVIVAFDSQCYPKRDFVESLVREHIPFAMMPQSDGLPVFGFQWNYFFSHDTMLVTYRNNLAKPLQRIAKIAFDLSVATLALIVLAPLLLMVALLVKLDGGPVLFLHSRIGAGGREFKCLKFRSMSVHGDSMLERLLIHNSGTAAEWAATHKLRNDPRVTRIGRLLRRTSLDELPQLFNVLRLEMSLVGPRPIVRHEVPRYAEDIAYYYEARPGITGLWQISGRSDASYERRVRLDCWYVKNWTIWHDITILAKTIPVVLNRKGAY